MSTPLLSSDTAQTLGAAVASMTSDSRFSFLQKFREERLGTIRPIGDFFDKNRISATTSFHTISQRWNYNLQYFSANYLVIILALSIYAIFSSKWLLLTLVTVFGGFYLISRLNGPLMIGGTALSSSTLYASHAGISLLLLLICGLTGTIFWIIGAAAIVILGHAALLEPGLEGDFSADGQV